MNNNEGNDTRMRNGFQKEAGAVDRVGYLQNTGSLHNIRFDFKGMNVKFTKCKCTVIGVPSSKTTVGEIDRSRRWLRLQVLAGRLL